jgi:hypothetical protein
MTSRVKPIWSRMSLVMIVEEKAAMLSGSSFG